MNVSLDVIYFVIINLIKFSYTCPQGFKNLIDSKENKCYQLFDEEVDYFSALEKCRSLNSHLVTIESKHDNMMLEETFSRDTDDHHHHYHHPVFLDHGNNDYAVWIGLMRSSNGNSDSSFRWINGNRLNYTNWDKDEPSDNRRNCFLLINSGHWTGDHCNKKFPFICEIESDFESSIIHSRVMMFNHQLKQLQQDKQIFFHQLDIQIECILALTCLSCFMILIIIAQLYFGFFRCRRTPHLTRNNDKNEQENTYNNNFPSLSFENNFTP